MAIALDRDGGVAVREFGKGVLRRLPPESLLQLKRAYALTMTRSARKAFESAPTSPMWLDETELDRLQGVYHGPPRTYGIDPVSLEQRGRRRGTMLKTLLSSSFTRPKTVELGCADGMVSAALSRAGAEATAVDLTRRRFDARAKRAGVRFIETDVSHLPLDDGHSDLVFSFNSFEHFADPAVVFAEAIRVAKPGGLIFLSFGPLYMSPFGPHSAQSIKVPYSHHLFPREVLDAYVQRTALPPIPHDTTNRWTLLEFRNLWDSHAGELERLVYREVPEVHGIELVVRHPQCFRSKTAFFHDLTIGTIEAAFRTRA